MLNCTDSISGFINHTPAVHSRTPHPNICLCLPMLRLLRRCQKNCRTAFWMTVYMVASDAQGMQ